MTPEDILEAQAQRPEKAITELWNEGAWAQSPLPLGVANRLKRVDYCLEAMAGIQAMLFEDALGEDDKSDSGAEFEGLGSYKVHVLRIALKELSRAAGDSLGEIRDPEHGCHELRPARECGQGVRS